MNQPHNPPAVSQATNQARQWFEGNRRRYAPDDVQLFDRLIPLVEKPLHLHALSEELKRRMLPETKDRAAQPSLTRELSPAPTNRTTRSDLAQADERKQSPISHLIHKSHSRPHLRTHDARRIPTQDYKRR